MPTGDRSDYFPAIEKKYGQPMEYWFRRMEQISDWKYPEQVAYLKNNHGFSQAHANALVMYSRGSKSSKKFVSTADYFKKADKQQVKTMRAIFKAIQSKFPQLELVIAWNQPMLKYGNDYVFGISTTKNYLLLAPWSKGVLRKFAPRLKEYKVNQKTIKVPPDWEIDVKLLQDMAKMRIAEIK